MQRAAVLQAIGIEVDQVGLFVADIAAHDPPSGNQRADRQAESLVTFRRPGGKCSNYFQFHPLNARFVVPTATLTPTASVAGSEIRPLSIINGNRGVRFPASYLSANSMYLSVRFGAHSQLVFILFHGDPYQLASCAYAGLLE
jgi:hypothetical protein